ncbi:hypothetical protein SELMODRAFT_428860 [Selaginella moellendorffii]|uniref:Uncharacterized protein n=1 Tax=Selaginella moellendorffii TaxID=88036 RepID=D8T487_SELML|nr:hypothetical protein SELMODRAFT_428860 [Selaginella moellendorffii]
MDWRPRDWRTRVVCCIYSYLSHGIFIKTWLHKVCQAKYDKQGMFWVWLWHAARRHANGYAGCGEETELLKALELMELLRAHKGVVVQAIGKVDKVNPSTLVMTNANLLRAQPLSSRLL